METIDILQRAKEICSSKGGRLTTKRQLVLALLVESEHPLSAYEIADLYQQKTNETIPAMSVYRMLDFLSDVNLVHKLASTNKFMACTHIACEHQHEKPQFLICDNCHSVSEIGIDNNLISELEKSIAAKHFQLSSPQLELHGICDKCQP
jgi:Fur family zinc uptake transcriptional regulator